jgi:hypothetical protein
LRRTLCACLLAILVSAAAAVDATASQRRVCGTEGGYGYAGLQSVRKAHGVRATITALARPYVESGHVAAWVGVGGPRQGPGGTDAWLQVGLAGFASSADSKLYYEVAEPGKTPRYHEILNRVDPGRHTRVAVLEMSGRPHHWRVWVDGTPVSEPIFLPRSGGRWRPIATAETWDGGRQGCNGFGYRFDRLRVAGARGGSWRRFRRGYRFEDPGYRVEQRHRGTFRALATAVPVWQPGWWEERLRAVEPPQPAASGEPAPPVTG